MTEAYLTQKEREALEMFDELPPTKTTLTARELAESKGLRNDHNSSHSAAGVLRSLARKGEVVNTGMGSPVKWRLPREDER